MKLGSLKSLKSLKSQQSPRVGFGVIAVLALLGGIALGVLLSPQVPQWAEPYLPIAVVAALIVWLGDQLGVGTQLSTAVIVVLGIRIFGNAAALRRRLFGA